MLSVLLTACGSTAGESAAGSKPEIRLNLGSSGSGTVDVVGLSADDLVSLENAALTLEGWTALLRIEVADDGQPVPGQPAVLGAYSVGEGVVRFTPEFPFDPGQRYNATFDQSLLTSAQKGSARLAKPITATIDIPAPVRSTSTHVVAVYPSGPELPENQLRLYLVFSAPMGLRDGAPHVKLLDEQGLTVIDPFLPLEVNLWNESRTRYTLLFDPGRVKRGILPNEEMGPSLIAGRKYTLVVDASWHDAAGQPLAAAFRREFRVGPPRDRAIDPSEWRLAVPRPGSREPLTVSFPAPLDYGLLHRALSVSSDAGQWVDGQIALDRAETRWLFTPKGPWTSGEYRLVAAPILEDIAGNRIGRPFEVAFLSGRAAPRATGGVVPFRIE